MAKYRKHLFIYYFTLSGYHAWQQRDVRRYIKRTVKESAKEQLLGMCREYYRLPSISVGVFGTK